MIERLLSCIQLYNRFIDDQFIIWTGYVAQLCEFRKALATADSNISLDWTDYKSPKQPMDPIVVEAFQHERAIFLDLDMFLKCTLVSQRFCSTFTSSSDIPALLEARQRIRLHSLQLLPRTTVTCSEDRSFPKFSAY
jgi:hypothetical protein